LATRKLRKLFTPVKIRRGLEENLWLVGSRATTGIENDPGVSQLVVAGILGLDHVPAKDSDVEVLRFLLIPHGEEVRDEKKPTEKWNCSLGFFFEVTTCAEPKGQRRSDQRGWRWQQAKRRWLSDSLRRLTLTNSRVNTA
jgi:hypothetical protein